MDTDGKLDHALSFGSWQFLKGFIAGQIVLFIFSIALFHYLFLKGPLELRRTKKHASTSSTALSNDNITANGLHLDRRFEIPNRQILEMFNYNPSSTVSAETCQWLNILIAQFLMHLRSSALFHQELSKKLSTMLSKQMETDKPLVINDLKLVGFSLGSQFPRILNAKVNHSESGRLRYDLRIEYVDDISLSLDGSTVLNWPVDLLAALPFSITAALQKVSGTLSIEIMSNGESEYQTVENGILQAQLTFLHDAVFEFHISSIVGHKTKLKDLSKLSLLISTLLQNAVEEEIVWPNHRIFSYSSALQ